MSLRKLILIIINSLVFLVTIALSITFYNQFSKVLDDRILMQLNSIKTLKMVQLERLIQTEWDRFKQDPNAGVFMDSTEFTIPTNKLQHSGIYDFTNFNSNKETSIGLVLKHKNENKVKIIPYNRIKDILLERTGMGETGESYLVGEDYHLRSQSRFLPDQPPNRILARTTGVKSAFKDKDGSGIYKDYRGVEVYGVFSLMNLSELRLVILSEIDKAEVLAPLQKLKLRLLGLIVIITFLAVILSLFLTRIIANPIINMKKSLKIMAEGNYNQNDNFGKNSIEIKEMFEALENLKESLRGALKFSDDIGKMNLHAQYEPRGQNDSLGKSLLKMRDKLIEFRNKESKNRMNTKRLLVDGLEKERQRLARELHDGVGPLLTALKFHIENTIENDQQRAEMKKMVDATISEIRTMSNALMPAIINDFGVGSALENFVESAKKSSGINIDFEDLSKHDKSKITKTQAIHIFRISQELINNSLKHSNARNIKITLSEFDDFISLFYFDDGIGFKMNEAKLGSGIINIRERVEICNGTILFSSKINNTTFEIEIPIEKDHENH